MGRNLYILAGALGFFGVVSIVLSATGLSQNAGDAALWRTTGIALVLLALVTSLGGVLSHLFEQAERRAETQRQQRRRERNHLRGDR